MEPDETPSDENGDENGDAIESSRPIDSFRRTAAGTVIAAGLLGMRDALEGRPEKEEVAIVNDAPEPAPTEGFTLEFDPDDPSSLKVHLDPKPPTSN